MTVYNYTIGPESMGAEGDVVIVGGNVQGQLIQKNQEKCFDEIVRHGYTNNGSVCPMTWDGVMCWPESEAGAMAIQRCPNYVNGFNISGFATRECDVNGEWKIYSDMNYSWTNFSNCFSPIPTNEPFILGRKHIEQIIIIANVGYGLSLVTLLAACLLMCCLKKLRCPRTTLHVHLFISFILRAAIAFINNNVFIDNIGLQKDFETDADGEMVFTKGATHWECKLLHVVHLYFVCANCMWIFVEGLYLHMLIFMSVFSENSTVRNYIIFGWASPLIFLIPWVVVQAVLNDVMCWTFSDTTYFWIIRGPITLAIVVNFVFFLNILRVLFTKLRASNNSEARRYRYRKLAKSTLVLIPLFGVHNMIFIWVDPARTGHGLQLIWLYFEMTFNSFQGFFISILFCFLNDEVKSEVRKKWNRWQLRRDSTLRASHRSTIFNTTVTFTNSRLRTSRTPSLNVDDSSRRSSSSPKGQKINGILKMNNRSRSATRSRSNSRTDLDLIATEAAKQVPKRTEETRLLSPGEKQ